jgi:hypothetical protein
MILKNLLNVTPSDTIALASTAVVGELGNAPTTTTILVQLACFLITKLPTIIRAVSAQRRARRATKNV